MAGRALAALLGAVLLVVVVQSPVAAADWSREVTFPAVGGGDPGTAVLDWTILGSDSSCTASAWYGRGFQHADGSTPGFSQTWSNGGFSVCRDLFTQRWVPSAGLTPGVAYTVSVGWMGGSTATLNLYWLTGAYHAATSVFGASLATSTGCNPSNGGCIQQLSVTVTAPPVTEATVVGIAFVYSEQYAGPEYYTIVPLSGVSGGDCVGTGALAQFSAYVTGSWGDEWTSTYGACVATTGHVVSYRPADWVGGHLFQFWENFAAARPDASSRVKIEWLDAGGVLGTAFDYSAAAIGTGYWTSFSLTSPSGSKGVRWTIYPGTVQFLHGVADVDVAGAGASSGSSTGGNGVGSTCTPPSSLVDLGGMVGWGACVVNNAITGVVNGITQGFYHLVLTLFTPSSATGDAWAAMLAGMAGHTPFAQVGSVFAAIADGLSGSGSSQVTMPVWTVNSVNVAAGLNLYSLGGLSAMDPYRGMMFGLVAVWMVWGTVGSIRAQFVPQQQSLGL